MQTDRLTCNHESVINLMEMAMQWGLDYTVYEGIAQDNYIIYGATGIIIKGGENRITGETIKGIEPREFIIIAEYHLEDCDPTYDIIATDDISILDEYMDKFEELENKRVDRLDLTK